MKNLLLIAVFTTLLVSCNKLTDKNIRGNWQVEKETVNGTNVTPAVPTYFAFNTGGECNYFQDSSGIYYYSPLTWQLDEKSQVLTLSQTDTSGTWTAPYQVDKKGKEMTLTYTVGSVTQVYELKQVILNY
jgi:hypothetical protein